MKLNRWLKHAAFLLLLFLFVVAIGFAALPQVVAAVPGQYRHRLPEPLLDLVTTPMPAALPAPELKPGSYERSSVVDIELPALAAATPTLHETPRPTATQPPEAELGAAVTGLGETGMNATPHPSPTPLPTATATPSPTPSPTATATPQPPPPSARIDGLRIVAQGFNNCGPATLTVNLNFYGVAHRQADVAAVLKPNPEDRNVTPEEMRDYVLNHTDLRATVHRGGDLTLLKRFVAAGFPVIIEKGYEPDARLGWMGHYLTIFAYNDEQGEFRAIDTYLGPWDSSGYRYSYEHIERVWNQFNNAFVVLYRPEQEAAVHDILGPEMLEPTAMWQNVALAAHAATRDRPGDAFAWFNLGSSLTRLGELTGNTEYFEMAAASFDRSREIGLPPRMLWYQFEPYRAYLEVGRLDDVFTLTDAILRHEGGRGVEETYYYRGLVLLAQGDRDGARNAFRRAVQLNANYIPPQEALSSLE
jgi:hypothetical protein